MNQRQLRFERDRRDFLMDCDMVRAKSLEEGGIRLRWVAELDGRLRELRDRAVDPAFGAFLATLQQRKRFT